MLVGMTGSCIKLTADHRLSIQSDITGDIVVVDKSMTRIACLNAKTKNRIDGDKRLFRHSCDNRYLVWCTGVPELILVSIANMQPYKTVQEFWRPSSTDSSAYSVMPVAVVANIDAKDIVGLANLSTGTGPLARIVDQVIIHYRSESHSIDYLASQLFPEGNLRFSSRRSVLSRNPAIRRRDTGSWRREGTCIIEHRTSLQMQADDSFADRQAYCHRLQFADQ